MVLIIQFLYLSRKFFTLYFFQTPLIVIGAIKCFDIIQRYRVFFIIFILYALLSVFYIITFIITIECLLYVI
jgi:hypothetical protein